MMSEISPLDRTKVWEWLREHRRNARTPEDMAGMTWATYLRDAPGARDELPIAVEELAKWLEVDVRVVRTPMPQAGTAETRSGEARVRVRAADHIHHRRFSLAHELGHVLLHPPGEYDRSSADSEFFRSPEEVEANSFGAALLMPRDRLYTDVLRIGLNIARLARMYLVSETAMTFRLKVIGALP